MRVLIHGMICESKYQETRDGKQTPVTFLFSGGETVKISGIYFDEEYVGQLVDVLADLKLAEYEGRKYLRITAVNES